VEAIEEAVLKGADRAAADLFRLRKQLLSVRRLLAPTGDVLTQAVRREQRRLPESLGPYFADIKDHVANVLDELDSSRDLLATALDIHSESMFARLGLIVQRLTAITVIIMVPNLVASIYGMNFETFFPPHDWEYGFPAVVGLIVVMIAWGFIHSRLLRWL
jgi:magnesium transporter